MHNGMLELGDEKMAKSVGNIRGLHEVLDAVGRRRADPVLQLRPLPAAAGVLATSGSRRRSGRRARIRDAARRLVTGAVAGVAGAVPRRFFAALRDDFNTAEALGLAVRLGSRGERSGAGGRFPPEGDARRARVDRLMARMRRRRTEAGESPRSATPRARTSDWAEADRLRDELRAMGWEVRDGPDGPELVPAS